MFMRKFDLDLFWSLPRCGGTFKREGSYCALGAGMKAMGLSDIELSWENVGLVLGLSKTERELIYETNDGCSNPSNTREANPEKAKRMLLEALEGKVEFVSKEVTFTEEEVVAKV